jgi:glucose/arabinose dehydrogenase
MRFHGNASERLGRLGLGMTMAAALAVTLAACSSSGAASQVTTTQPSSAPASATAQAASTPAAPATTAPATTAATNLAGTWSGKYSGAYQGTFTLTWQQTGSRLNGSIKLSAPPQTLTINGKVDGGTISFGTVGSADITYSGTVSGSSMSGNYQVHAPNGAVGGPWSAAKSS